MRARRGCAADRTVLALARPRTLLVLALAVALSLPLLTLTPSAPARAAAINTALARAQCDTWPTQARSNDAEQATDLMAGRAALAKYGTVTIPADPDWKPQPTLDSSGDAHMHSLFYLVPLLRVGVKTGDQAMIDRFYALIQDWGRDNRPGMPNPPNPAAWQPIYTGFRMSTLACALAGPRGAEPWLADLVRVQGDFATTYSSSLATNNTGLHLAMGQWALGCATGRADWKAAALSRADTLAKNLLFPDGTSNEGAVGYIAEDYTWFKGAQAKVRACNGTPPASFARADRIPGFLAHAIRPDRRYEALGDAVPRLASVSQLRRTAAEYPATGGASGTKPSRLFARFPTGGYVFGRSTWGAPKHPFSSASYYSIRAGQGPDGGVFHAHEDAGAVTFYARGSEKLFDTGQYAYQYGDKRQFVTSRSSHNVLDVDGVAYSSKLAPTTAAATTTSGYDLTTLVDTGYPGVKLTRTVMYSRTGGYLVVWDTATSSTRHSYRQIWNLGRDRSWTSTSRSIATHGTGSDVSLSWVGTAPTLQVTRGATDPLLGWNSQVYGELVPSPTATASRTGTSATWLTVIVPVSGTTNASRITSSGTVTADVAKVVVNMPGKVQKVSLTRSRATVG